MFPMPGPAGNTVGVPHVSRVRRRCESCGTRVHDTGQRDGGVCTGDRKEVAQYLSHEV